MKRTITSIFLAAILAAALASSSCSTEKYSGKAEAITIGMESTAVNSLIYIAEHQNLFANNGLNVTIKNYPSGLAAVDGMLASEVDIATASEFVIVGKAFTKERINILGTIDRFLHIYLIGRKDSGIDQISDLHGKRIGVALKTAAEFYLGRFLDLNGISTKQVTLVNVNPQQSVDALLNGDIDAVIAWRPNVNAIQDRLGNRVVIWQAQNDQAAYCAAVATADWTAKHPELVKRLLSSLVQAETYAVGLPDGGRAIVQKKLGYDDSYIATVWPEHQLSVSLDQSLVLALEDEARWIMNNDLTGERQTPDFLKYIYVAGLDSVRPGSVNIVR